MEELKKSEDSNALVIPDDLTRFFEKQLKPDQSRALVFDNDKQRNIGVLKKGLMKPGQISFETLRRAANAVPIARICVNVLKEKITKTKWIIKTKDPMAKADESQVKELTELLTNPNEQDSMRSFLDKILEDLLVLDTVAIEKTRYPDDKLAQLYQVDASTIRPVFDEFGNQDIHVPLPNGETPPVSYLQIFNNSMYGGPESGDIVAAWPKKDFIYFHMHPQGSVDNFGYGLSPIEGVLSLVSNLLSADNFNGTYFDTGAFPPIILQLAQSLSQRDLERYREYLYQQIEGEFHRPAIVAGGGEMKIHNLKDLSNRDMQFMEYSLWLAKLLAAAYGLSPEDIGLTDTTGSKNVSETQKDLSEAKGYGSILHLLKEIINQQILWKDFGYTELEFDWVAVDSLDPKTSADIQDVRLKNGTMTLNEAREKNGDLPYEEWADQPMILKAEGYAVIHTDDHENVDEESDVANEKVYSKSFKSISKAVYTVGGLKVWFDDRGYGQPFIWQDILSGSGSVVKPPVAVNLTSQELECSITNELAAMGLNVKPVNKSTYANLVSGMPQEILVEFDKYCNMTPEYDSEKWRAKHGGSRKYPYYLVSELVDGFSLNSQQIRDDMKRDPTSYTQAVIDLAKLWTIEKEMVLGDRRADQYIITKDKCAYGIDYQFKGDFKRWEDTSTSIQKFLIQIPQLYNLFMDTIGQEKQNLSKKQYTIKERMKRLFKN
jgi:HK97 family phage portal protein